MNCKKYDSYPLIYTYIYIGVDKRHIDECTYHFVVSDEVVEEEEVSPPVLVAVLGIGDVARVERPARYVGVEARVEHQHEHVRRQDTVMATENQPQTIYSYIRIPQVHIMPSTGANI